MMSSWKCCRMCLGMDSLHPIFAKPKYCNKYTQVILSTTGIKIEPTDSLPQEICTRCIYLVNNTHKFRQKCDQSQKILLQRLNDDKVKEIKLEFSTVKTEIMENVIDISDLVDETMQDDEILGKAENNDNHGIDDSGEHTANDENNDIIDSIEMETAENTEKPIEVRVSKRTPVIPITRPLPNKKSVGEIIEKVREDIECEYCHKILTSRLSLRNHYKIHTGFDVVCEHCGKKFITKRLLLMHCRAKHGYEKTDKCSYCDYKASNAEQVKIHERLHTGEKPYVCSSCGAGFHRKSSYLQHVAIHLPEKNIQCDLCHARFKSVTLMRIHRHRHREIRYWFKCRVCENTFVRRRNVSRHLQRMHGLEPTNEHIERVKITQ